MGAEGSDTPYLVTINKPKVPRSSWISAGQLEFDRTVKDKLWFADGFGVMISTDLKSPASINFAAVDNGMEALVSNQIIHPPGGVAVGTGWDLGGFRFTNPDKNADAQIYKSGFLPAGASTGWGKIQRIWWPT